MEILFFDLPNHTIFFGWVLSCWPRVQNHWISLNWHGMKKVAIIPIMLNEAQASNHYNCWSGTCIASILSWHSAFLQVFLHHLKLISRWTKHNTYVAYSGKPMFTAFALGLLPVSIYLWSKFCDTVLHIDLQVEVERMRASAHEKLMNQLAAVRHKAEEKRATAEAKRNQQAARIAQQADYIRRTGRIPSSFSCWSWCS